MGHLVDSFGQMTFQDFAYLRAGVVEQASAVRVALSLAGVLKIGSRSQQHPGQRDMRILPRLCVTGVSRAMHRPADR